LTSSIFFISGFLGNSKLKTSPILTIHEFLPSTISQGE
jgi:hypothetical protein